MEVGTCGMRSSECGMDGSPTGDFQSGIADFEREYGIRKGMPRTFLPYVGSAAVQTGTLDDRETRK